MNTTRLQKIKRKVGKIPFAAPLYHSLKGSYYYADFIRDFFAFKKMSGANPRFPRIVDQAVPMPY